MNTPVTITNTTIQAPASAATAAAARSATQRVIVVGASSGIGAALVRQLLSEGCAVAALARREALLEQLEQQTRATCASSGGRLIVRAHDVREWTAVPELFEQLVRALGGLDLIVYAAGVMPAVRADEYDTHKDVEQLAVNVAGCMAWCNAAARLFLTQRSGTIVGISSIAGDRGRKGNPAYCTTKAAVNTFLEALRNRLAEHGAHVCTIKPGFVDTDMTRGMPGLFWLISAERAAQLILKAARARADVRYVPRRWGLVGLVIRCIPRFLFKRMNV